jgi:hypothetical protein
VFTNLIFDLQLNEHCPIGEELMVSTSSRGDSTWSMMLLGFLGLGYAAWRGGRKGGVSTIEA